MSSTRSRNKTLTIGRFLSVCLMLFCVTFLTSANYFMYPGTSDDDHKVNVFGMNSEETDNDYPPSGPTEEKSSNPSLSITEEILHEAHSEFNFEASNQFYLHHIAEAEKVEMFHPERVLPPPKS